MKPRNARKKFVIIEIIAEKTVETKN